MPKRNPTCDCSPCNESALVNSPYCRCIPARLCATFTAEECECDGISSLLQLDEFDEYSGTVSCGDEVADFLVYLYFEDQTAYWRVESEALEIDELFEIGPGEQPCDTPSLELTVNFEECSGTLTIEPHEVSGLEPREVDGIDEPWCGTCECVCKTLCVRRWTGAEFVDEELEWDDETHAWGDIALALDEYTGGCVVLIEDFDPVPVSECATGLSFYVENETGSVTGKCKACSCDELCSGCCFPIDYDPVFGWYPLEIPFTVDAPNCATLDGHTDWFDPTLSSDKKRGHCGVCGIYIATEDVLITGEGFFDDDGICSNTPCQVSICFALECVEDSDTDPADCCARVRLILGVSEKFVGTKTPPPSGSFSTCQYYIRIEATSCECDEEGGISAIFSLEGLSFTCADIITSGPCYGQPACCTPLNCTLQGATLVI